MLNPKHLFNACNVRSVHLSNALAILHEDECWLQGSLPHHLIIINVQSLSSAEGRCNRSSANMSLSSKIQVQSGQREASDTGVVLYRVKANLASGTYHLLDAVRLHCLVQCF